MLRRDPRKRNVKEGSDEDMKNLEMIKERSGKSFVVTLRGSIVEGSKNFIVKGLADVRKSKDPLTFDFFEVTIINSIGIGEWVEMLTEFGANRKITYTRCPPNVVDTINLVPAFLGSATLQDIYTDFHCVACGHDARQLLTVNQDLSSDGELLKRIECQQCGSIMETAEPEEDTFAFRQAARG